MSQLANIARARHLYLQGQPQNEIARALGVSKQTVTGWKQKEQWGPTVKEAAAAAQRQAAFHLFREGKSQQQIAQQLSVSENTVTTWKKEGHWLARVALLQDKRFEEALTQVRKAVLTQVAELRANRLDYPANSLELALAYVCQQLDRGGPGPAAP